MTERGKALWSLTREWYWPSEVAKICQVSKQTVYNWIQEGRITTILKTRPFKIRREEVERILDRQDFGLAKADATNIPHR
jgi:excisionase family DNA binding protein